MQAVALLSEAAKLHADAEAIRVVDSDYGPRFTTNDVPVVMGAGTEDAGGAIWVDVLSAVGAQ